MDPKFAAYVETLQGSFERLRTPRPEGERLPRGKVPGVYLFSEGGKALYVGRSNDIRGRYGRHCNPGATFRMAAFAIRLTKDSMGRGRATYRKGEGVGPWLKSDPAAREEFARQKRRIREMDFSYVKEDHPIRQCL